MRLGRRSGEEAVQGRASGGEVGNRSAREVLVQELLRHGANHGTEALVILLGRVSEASEDRVAEIGDVSGRVRGIGRYIKLQALH